MLIQAVGMVAYLMRYNFSEKCARKLRCVGKKEVHILKRVSMELRTDNFV